MSSAEDVHDFVKAYEFKHQQIEHNTGLLLAGLTVGGLVIAKGSGSSPAAVAGAATAVGAGGVALGRRVSQAHDDVQYSNLAFGEEHLLGGVFRIPAGLFLRKHVLLESQQKVKVPDEIGICFVKPKSGCVTVTVPRLRGM